MPLSGKHSMTTLTPGTPHYSLLTSLSLSLSFNLTTIFIPPLPSQPLHSPEHQNPAQIFLFKPTKPTTDQLLHHFNLSNINLSKKLGKLISKMSPAANSSSRWCPTPEQLMILEEMYRAGIRTPNASQIQHITAQLSLYGKIEGKNVFYWFQNHKARDRQKLRRKLCKQLQQQQLLYHHHHNYHNYHNNPYHHHHHQQQQQQSLLGYLDHLSPPASSSALQQLSNCHNYSSAGFLPPPQVGVEDALMNHAWKMEIPQRVEMEKSVMSMYGRDWMMMMMEDVGPPSPCCSTSTRTTTTRQPLKTLQLFPITATNLKEESSPSSSNPLSPPTTPTPNY